MVPLHPIHISAKQQATDFIPGKQWLPPKKAFRPTAGLSSYDKRQKERAALMVMKAKEKELKDEKEEIRKVYTLSHGQLELSTY